MKTIGSIILILVLVLGGGFLLFKYGNNTPGSHPSLTEAPNDQILRVNMAKAGLEQLSSEGTAMHIHQHLDIIINGQTFAVPDHIGIGIAFISPIHTHTNDGIIHVESAEVRDFKLSQLFDEWGVVFNDNCIAEFCADATHKLVVAVNGTPVVNVRDVILKSHDEIEIWYGPTSETPILIPSFTFPEGL